MPLASWIDEGSGAEPWVSFSRVEAQLAAGQTEEAVRLLTQIVLHPDLESRHYLQAWHLLRQLGASPHPSRARTLYGVVVEVGLDEGLDIVAVYADRTSRYANFTGARVSWGRPDLSLDSEIDAVLKAGAAVVERIGPGKGRPAAPAPGQVRIYMLTPSGLHFGEGAFEVLAADPLAGPVISATSAFLRSLITRTGYTVS